MSCFRTSSSAFHSYISGVHHFGWDFCVCDHFFNPTIEVVTFCLRGWCMLGVLAASLHLSWTWMSGYFQSERWNSCMHRLDFSLYSHPKAFGGMESEPMLTPREKIPSTRKILLRLPWYKLVLVYSFQSDHIEGILQYQGSIHRRSVNSTPEWSFILQSAVWRTSPGPRTPNHIL